jgi:hypothetical protein
MQRYARTRLYAEVSLISVEWQSGNRFTLTTREMNADQAKPFVEEYAIDGTLYTLGAANELLSAGLVPSPLKKLQRALPKKLLIRISELRELHGQLAVDPAWNSDSVRTLSARVGAIQLDFWEKRRTSVNVPGDSSFTVESTAAATGETYSDDPKHILFRTCEARLEWLKVVLEGDDLVAERSPELIETYWKSHVAPAIASSSGLMPLVYFMVWKKLDEGQGEARYAALSKLMRKTRLLSGMEGYSKGVSTAFVDVLGEDLFAETTDGIGSFQNRYYFDYKVKPKQSLHDLYRERWEHMPAYSVAASQIPSFDDFLAGLLSSPQNAYLASVPATQPLIEAGVKTVWLCPPLAQIKDYENRIRLFRASELGKTALSIAPPPPPTPSELPTTRLLRLGHDGRPVSLFYDTQRRTSPSREMSNEPPWVAIRRTCHLITPEHVMSLTDNVRALKMAKSNLLAPVERLGTATSVGDTSQSKATDSRTKRNAVETRMSSTEAVERIEAVFRLGDVVKARPQPPEIRQLRELLGGLSSRDVPVDRQHEFTDAVNRVLRATGYRIRLSDGSLAMLRVTHRSEQDSWIQFALTRGGCRKSLGNEEIDFVPMSIESRGSQK